MIRKTCFLLCLLLLMPVCVGCVKSENPDDITAETTLLSGDETSEGTEPENTGLIPEDFGNDDGSAQDFVIFVRRNRYDYIWAEGQTGERINDSTYERNMELEELYNINITISEAGEDSSAYFSNAILAGTGELRTLWFLGLLGGTFVAGAL